MNIEKKFEYDIDNIRQDLAIEDMVVTNEHIENLKRYANNEITMEEIINGVKQIAIERN